MNLKHEIVPRPILQTPESPFVTYVRTLMFRRFRFKDSEGFAPVHIDKGEIEKRFYPWPLFNLEREIAKLKVGGEIEVTEGKKNNGDKIYYYRALRPGSINLDMLPVRGRELDSITTMMMEYLGQVTLSCGNVDNLYFNTFQIIKKIDWKYTRLFFIVDDFCGRIHTPVTNLTHELREFVLLDGQKTVSMDVSTMQPLILGKILKEQIGHNEFSEWLDQGKDVYVILQEKAGLKSREDAKKRFFEITYSPPNDELNKLFRESSWINWVNEYKTRNIPENPHNMIKPHSNLAWLLQNTEVKVMRKVWLVLVEEGIPFLSVHDEIIVQQKNRKWAEEIFRDVLSREFVNYRLNCTCQSEEDKVPELTNTLPPMQTIGDFFDLCKENGYNTLPENCKGINAGKWISNRNLKTFSLGAGL